MTEEKKVWIVTFYDTIFADTEEEAYEQFHKYLARCVETRDITTFDFMEEEN